MAVYLPKQLETEIDNLTRQENEVQGALVGIYDASNQDHYIATIFLTGAGTSRHVEGDSVRVRRLVDFVKENPRFDYLMFHTHSEGTIRNFGQHYARNFSKGDMRTIAENKQRFGEHYFEYLFTPGWVTNSEYDASLDPVSLDWEDDDGTHWSEIRGRLDAILGN